MAQVERCEAMAKKNDLQAIRNKLEEVIPGLDELEEQIERAPVEIKGTMKLALRELCSARGLCEHYLAPRRKK